MTALILGATSPIARAIAAQYAAAGHAVYVAARDVDEAERIAADLHIRYEVTAVAGAFDAVSVEEHAAFIDRVHDAVGEVDVAVIAFGEMGEQ